MLKVRNYQRDNNSFYKNQEAKSGREDRCINERRQSKPDLSGQEANAPYR